MKTRWNLARRVATGVVAATTLAALTACSGGLGGQAPQAGSSDGGSASGDTLKIGLIAPFSGSESMFGDYMKFGAEVAIDEINAAGGVLGKQVELLTEDDACDATQGAAAAQKLVSAKIVASVGGYCSVSTKPTLPVFYSAKIPVLVSVANSDGLLQDRKDNVWLIDGTGTQQAGAALKWVQKEGFKKLVVIDDKTEYSANLATVFTALAKEVGLTVTTDSLTPKESDFSAQVAKLKGADFLYFTGYVQEAGTLVKQAVEGGFTGTILLGDGSVDKKVADIAGPENVAKVYATFTKTPDMLEDGGAFVALYAAKSGGKEPGPYTIHSYDTVKTWAAAAEAAGSTDFEKVDAALATISLEGLTGPIAFTPEGFRTGSGGFVIVKIADDGNFKFFEAVDE